MNSHSAMTDFAPPPELRQIHQGSMSAGGDRSPIKACVSMRWHDLLFAHWPVAAAELRPYIPPELEIDTFDGSAWLGIVPFHMTDVRLAIAPKCFGMAFSELNVRTYVRHGDERGVWFLSLDAQHWLSVRVARMWYGLSYYDSRIDRSREERLDGRGGSQPVIHFDSRRTHRGAAKADFDVEYEPEGESFHATPDTIDHWLIERYCLFSANRRGRATIAHIDHPPWTLHRAAATIRRNTMTDPLSIRLPSTKPILHFSHGVDAVSELAHALV